MANGAGGARGPQTYGSKANRAARARRAKQNRDRKVARPDNRGQDNIAEKTGKRAEAAIERWARENIPGYSKIDQDLPGEDAEPFDPNEIGKSAVKILSGPAKRYTLGAVGAVLILFALVRLTAPAIGAVAPVGKVAKIARAVK